MSEKKISRRRYLKYAAAGAVVAGAAAVGGAWYLTRPAPTAAGEFKHGGSVMYLTPMVGDFFFVACKEYLKRAVEADGWKFAFDNADWSDATQTDQLMTYADQYDIIFVFPTSMEGINEGIRIAEVEKHCPVIVQKNFVKGLHGRFCLSFNDFGTGQAQAKKACEFIKAKYGKEEGKVVCFSGDRAASGWRYRALGFLDEIEKHPGVEYEEWDCGGAPVGWGNQADLYFSTDTADAIVAGSAGAYFRGIMDALDRYGKLYYVGDSKHIYTTTIDGKPSELQWIRRGYMDDSFSQSPDCLFPIAWNLAKEYIVKNADYQKPPYTMPELTNLPIEVGAPPNAYWGEGNPKMKIDKALFLKDVPMPQGLSPVYSVHKGNVNNPNIWGNTYTFWKGKEDIQMLTWPNCKGTPPTWSQALLDEYEEMFNKYW